MTEAIHPKDINVGDVLWETFRGINTQFEVLTKPTVNDGQWSWKALTSAGEIDYMLLKGFEDQSSHISIDPDPSLETDYIENPL